MSEYQYYEFQAIDRPLDERAMIALRAITSRADITPTNLVNVYYFPSSTIMSSTCSRISVTLPSEPAPGKT